MTKENDIVMVTKLTNQLSVAYKAAEDAEDHDLQALLLKNATALNNDQPYVEVVTALSHDVSEYYIKHHHVSDEVMAIYQSIQADVKAGKVDDKALRRWSWAAGLAAAPVMFGGC